VPASPAQHRDACWRAFFAAYDHGLNLPDDELAHAWMAPEATPDPRTGFCGAYSFASDCYSFGVFLWEVLSARVPAHRAKGGGGHSLPISAAWPAELQALIMDCCQFNPAVRPTIAQVHDRLKSWAEALAKRSNVGLQVMLGGLRAQGAENIASWTESERPESERPRRFSEFWTHAELRPHASVRAAPAVNPRTASTPAREYDEFIASSPDRPSRVDSVLAEFRKLSSADRAEVVRSALADQNANRARSPPRRIQYART
jgi:serine/threonine protein kinase